ncbi:MAG TPA: helix-turn-helix domain-containing protein [Pseudonocardia sp.]|jgi:hypothetical protein|nr:helix-turn-helix domain-containing protein [Pseudonocardia sp.]
MAAERPHGVPWHRLLDDLWAHREQLTTDICARMQERLSAYQELPVERFSRYVALAMETTIRLARSDPPRLSSSRTTTLERVGEAQAQIGVPVDQMLLAWRIGVDRLVERGSCQAGGLGLDAQQVLDFTRAALAASDVGMAGTARAHRRADLERDREAQDRRASFVRAVLFGTGEPGELRARMKSYGLDPARPYHAVRARPVAGGATNAVARAIGLLDATDAGRGMRVIVDGDVAGFQLDRPGDAAPAMAGFGPAVPLERLADSFRLATRALHTLEAFGLAGTRDLGELALRAAVVADADVGAALRRRYLDPLVGTGSGGEIVTSLREYLAVGGHVETAAERLHVHPNTLRYRLARFEELTSVRLRDPMVAFEVWWALESAAIAGPD